MNLRLHMLWGGSPWWRHQMKTFSCYWPFVRGIESPHKGQWRGALMFCLICAWTNGWVNNGDSGDLRDHHTHFDVTVINKPMSSIPLFSPFFSRMKTFVTYWISCLHLTGVPTAVTYEHDMKKLADTSIISYIWITEKSINGALVPPTPNSKHYQEYSSWQSVRIWCKWADIALK